MPSTLEEAVTGVTGAIGAAASTALIAVPAARALTPQRAAPAAAASNGGWENQLLGVQVRRTGDWWVKRVNPDSSRLMQAWGRLTMRSQYRGLQSLEICPPATSCLMERCSLETLVLS